MCRKINLKKITKFPGFQIIRIVFFMAFLSDRGVLASMKAPVLLNSPEDLLCEASDCEIRILNSICSQLDNKLKEKLSIDCEKMELMSSAESIDLYKQLVSQKVLENVELLDLTSLNLEYLPYSIFSRMTNLKKLNLSGNKSINLDSLAVKIIYLQLVELNISNCNIDKESFSSVCSCSNLKKLVVSNNPNIRFSEHNLDKLESTLKHLEIENCNLSTDDMVAITNFSALEVLNISNNFLEEFFETLDYDYGNLYGTLLNFKASGVGMGLRGFSEIQNFSQIKLLDVSNNDLHEELPAYNFFMRILRWIISIILSIFRTQKPAENRSLLFGSLAFKLTSFNISRVNLSIDQLEEILNFENIQVLCCSYNDFSKLSSSFKIGKAKNSLIEADFSNCNASQQKLLEEILDCRCISKIDISNNRFAIAYSKLVFGNARKSLKWLSAIRSGVKVRPFIETLSKFEMLEYLDLSQNDFQLEDSYKPLNTLFNVNNVQSVFGNLKTTLKCLAISECQIRNDFDFLYSVTDCAVLESLDISTNKFSQFPKNFKFGSSTETLKYLNMNSCSLEDTYTLKAITDLKVLENISLDNNLFFSLENPEFRSSLNSLKKISLVKCGICSLSILKAVATCKTLETLDLSENDLSEKCSSFRSLDGPDLSQDLKNFDFTSSKLSLKNIKMSNCNLSSETVLRSILDCSNLKILDLSHNRFSKLSDNFALSKSRESLETLNLCSNAFESPEVLKKITDFKKLRHLYLSGNNFSGELDNFSFGVSKFSLKVLEMDRCYMTDMKLFKAITSCQALETLSIAENKFTFENLNFDASKNSLKGLDVQRLSCSRIEDFYSFFDCPRLEKLNISYMPLRHFEQDLNFEKFGSSKFTLKELKAKNCGLEAPSSLEILSSFPKLETIDISDNNFGLFPANFALGASKDTLIKITATFSNLQDGNIIKALTSCKKLEILILDSNRGLSMGEVTFGISKDSLRELSLEGCGIQALPWMNEIQQCTKMQKLNLSSNNLREIKNQFNCKNLIDSIVSLNLSNCQIDTLKIVSSLTKYKSLKFLRMDGNKLKALKSYYNFGNLTYKLDYFFLDNCELEKDSKKKIEKSFVFVETPFKQ